MIGLTRRQHDTLRFITIFQGANGRSPSYREIALGIGLSAENSKSTVHRLLSGLQERGAIRRQCSAERAIEVISPAPVSRAPDGAPLYFVRTGEAA